MMYILLDTDECIEDLHDCENCINTVGSYNCSCHAGYRLSIDGITCDGNFLWHYNIDHEMNIIKQI